MDRSVFINEMKELFSELNRKENLYSKVWLSDENFGGLYHSGMYILNLKSKHKINGYKSEVSFLNNVLNGKFGKEKGAYIFNLEVFNENEFAYPDSNDIILYSDDVVTNAA